MTKYKNVSGSYIKGQIALKGIMAKDVAKALDITPVSLTRKLKGMYPFKVDELLTICNMLNCDINDLLFVEKEKI